MEMSILQEFMIRYKNLNHLIPKIQEAAEIMIWTYKNGRKILVCGNGGSSSDAGHIVGELMKGFELKRPLDMTMQKKLKKISVERGACLAENLQQGLPAISLSAHTELLTAIANDIDANLIFAQQVVGYGKKDDVFIGLSTSGNSRNIVDALIVAKATAMKTIGITGETGGEMKKYSDVCINVPESRTAYIQELHIAVYHTLCLMVESSLFGNGSQIKIQTYQQNSHDSNPTHER